MRICVINHAPAKWWWDLGHSSAPEKSRRTHQIIPAEPICEIEDFFSVFRVPAVRGGFTTKILFSTVQQKNKKKP
jgi:hypothetical protein